MAGDHGNPLKTGNRTDLNKYRVRFAIRNIKSRHLVATSQKRHGWLINRVHLCNHGTRRGQCLTSDPIPITLLETVPLCGKRMLLAVFPPIPGILGLPSPLGILLVFLVKRFGQFPPMPFPLPRTLAFSVPTILLILHAGTGDECLPTVPTCLFHAPFCLPRKIAPQKDAMTFMLPGATRRSWTTGRKTGNRKQAKEDIGTKRSTAYGPPRHQKAGKTFAQRFWGGAGCRLC